MKAARLVERRKPLELTDLPDPVPGTGEVVIEVEAEGICRTDWHVWNGDWDWVGLTPTLPLVAVHDAGGIGPSALRIAAALGGRDAMDSYETLGFSVITGF
jgi:D-arabinose 1-dehydrogenase-like Zn-dependent alcohol dehydrogenase